MNSIDRMNAPEGATHWSPAEGEHRLEAYWRPGKNGSYDCWAVCSAGHFWQTNRYPLPDYAKRLTPLVATWNGPEDGLPPVGLEVEIRLRNELGVNSWCRAKILFCRDTALVFEWAVQGTAYATTLNQVEVRPIRTAEQLAAKVRSNACDEIYGVLCSAAREGNRSDMAEALYDAGYRKVQP